MIIYMVTVSDTETIDDITRAIENGEDIYIGPSIRKGPVEEIREYVNVG